MEIEVDHYKVLGLPTGEFGANLTQQDIREAYKKKARELHPDKCRDDPDEANANFQKLQFSYEILKDEKARKVFDDRVRVKHEKQHHQNQYEEKRNQNQYEEKRKKMVSELEKREKFCGSGLDPEEERTAKKLREEIVAIRVKHAASTNEAGVCGKRPSCLRRRRSEFPSARKHRNVFVESDGLEAFESCVLGKMRKYFLD